MLNYYSPLASVLPWSDDQNAERENSRRVPSPIKASTADYSWPSLYGNPPITDINKDAFQYIHRIYCRECREQERMAAANQSNSSLIQTGGSHPDSPPQYQMDQMSLAASIDVNKEALSRKLMLRPSVSDLVNQGIYPSLNTPAAFAVERRHLERAQTGDKLKHKIQMRPDKQFLVQHHILEDSNVDPSLQSTQLKLKKAKLTDDLNEKIANRPGPLELVQQSILEVEEPIKDAIKEGKLEFHKTKEGVPPASISKLPYEVESPKSGTSSPEPLDCDNDSNSSSVTSTGFSHIPSPPDIAPLLKSAQHITIGGQTIELPATTAQSIASSTGTFTAVTVAPQLYSSTANIHHQKPSNFSTSRISRKVSKQTRPKQQQKQRIIKFHEYKGPSASKSNNSNSSSSGSSAGSFVTTTGPLQKLDGLTPYQVRVQQQQLYLQCQLEVQNKGSIPTVLVPIQAPSTSVMKQNTPELSPPKQLEQNRSRPVTPAMKSPPPPTPGGPHTPLHVSRSLSNLEDMKVADLKQELKQRNLPVSGSKPQLIERLRSHQLQEMSTNIPSVGSISDIGSYSSMPSVQSYSDESIIASPSVASTSGRVNTPPMSPRDDFIKPPGSVRPTDMDTDDSQGMKVSADAVIREQAKKIEELQRALSLMQSQTQLQLVQQPIVMAPSAPAHIEQTITPTQQSPVQPTVSEQSPVDITDKQVFLATPDGKMTAYKVVLHTGSNLVQNMAPRSDDQSQVSILDNSLELGSAVQSPKSSSVGPSSQSQSQSKPILNENGNITSSEFEDVLEVLMRTGEMDAKHLLSNTKEREKEDNSQKNQLNPTSNSCFHQTSATSTTQHINNMDSISNFNDLPLHEQLSPLVDMDWMESDTTNSYLDNIDSSTNTNVDGPDLTFTDNENLDWLTDVIQLESESAPTMEVTNTGGMFSLNSTNCQTADPVLTPKAHDVLTIFNIDESESRAADPSINWDKLIGHSPHHL